MQRLRDEFMIRHQSVTLNHQNRFRVETQQNEFIVF